MRDITAREDAGVRLTAVVAASIGLVLLFGDVTGIDALVRLSGAAVLAVALLRWLDEAHHELTGVVVALWVATGALGVVQPGLELRTYATIVGLAVVIGSALTLLAELRDDVRNWAAVTGAAAGIVLGLAAVVWPTVTVLVLAVAVGGFTVLRAVAAFAGTVRVRSTDRPGWVALALRLSGLVAAVLVLIVAVAINRSGPDAVSAFYDAPDELPGPAGTLVRTEQVQPFLSGATAHRVLYVTTSRTGQEVTATGLVVVPEGAAPNGGRPVAAFTHGTIGIARDCAPSALDGSVYGPAIPGARQFLDAGYVVVAPDYAGLGSEATTGYLVGTDEARSTLDGVRAAAAVDDADVSSRFVVYGESQGGHAALFTGEQAGEYAPELDLVGVAAAAPATDLRELLAANLGTPFGDILASFALASWVDAYPELDLDLDDVVDPDARPAVERLATMCIQDQRQIVALFAEAAILAERFLSALPWEVDPWASVIEENTPGRSPTDAPVLILQGEDDPLVLPAVQERWVEDLCAVTSSVEFRTYPDVGHLDAGHATAADIVEWAGQRMSGEDPVSTC